MVLGIRGIEESSVYQDIFAKGVAAGEAKVEARARAKGRIEQARVSILLVGGKKFGQPDESMRLRIQAIEDELQLNALLDRLLDVSTWDELLAVQGQ